MEKNNFKSWIKAPRYRIHCNEGNGAEGFWKIPRKDLHSWTILLMSYTENTAHVWAWGVSLISSKFGRDYELKRIIESDKKELGDNFCRECAYCMHYPEEINVIRLAQISLWIRRFQPNRSLSGIWKHWRGNGQRQVQNRAVFRWRKRIANGLFRKGSYLWKRQIL